MATRSELETVLGNTYAAVGSATPGSVIVGNPTYQYPVIETGKDQRENPLANDRIVTMLVIDEGLPGEAAYFFGNSFNFGSDGTITNPSSILKKIHEVYLSSELRARVSGAIIKAYQNIWNEAPGTPDHAERIATAKHGYRDHNLHLDIYMQIVAMNATIQTSGNAALDSDIEWIVNSEVINVFSILELTV